MAHRAVRAGSIDPDANMDPYISFRIEIGRDPDDPGQLFSRISKRQDPPCLASIAAVLRTLADSFEEQHQAGGCW